MYKYELWKSINTNEIQDPSHNHEIRFNFKKHKSYVAKGLVSERVHINNQTCHIVSPFQYCELGSHQFLRPGQKLEGPFQTTPRLSHSPVSVWPEQFAGEAALN